VRETPILHVAVRLIVPVTVVAVTLAAIAGACGDDSVELIEDGQPPLLELLDELEAHGGILHLQTEQFTRLGVVSSYEEGGKAFRLPEYVINDQWIRAGGGDNETLAVGLNRQPDGTFIARFRSADDGAYVSEHVPSGTISERRPVVVGEYGTEPESVAQVLRDNIALTRTRFEDEIAAGQLTVEPSGNDGTIVLVRPRAGGCGRGMSSEVPAGVVEERTEVTEADYVPVYTTCIVTTPDGQEILVNEDVPRWERLDVSRWNGIVSFVFGD
jgi:hypothetical protein